MTDSRKEIRFDVEALPELDTAVAISGAQHRQEVGGGVCLSIAAGIALYYGSRP